MVQHITYVLKGYGTIEPGWVQDCFRLFRERSINIRKLLLLKTADPDKYAMLEVQFVVASDAGPFLDTLEQCLNKQCWSSKELKPLLS
jgi:glycine cleavage system regulatory protein